MIKTSPNTRSVFVFWLPLALTWLMMSIEGPYLAAIIARMGEIKFNLAAYGVAYAIGLVVEAPIIMIMSASTALVQDRDSYIKLKRFTYFLNLIITLVMLILVIPPVFKTMVVKVIGLPPVVDDLAHIAVALLIPWPAAIGFRRFYQGLLIRAGLTRRVTLGTGVRLFTMSATAAGLFMWSKFPGAYVGAISLSAGVTAEAIVIRILVNNVIKNLQQTELRSEQPLTYNEITKFYYPLALMTIIGLGMQSMLTFFVAKGRYPLESLAVLPVIHSLVFLFRSIGLSFQEVIIAFMNENNSAYKVLRRFATYMSIAVTIGLGLVVFTDLSIIWYEAITGLSAELSEFAIFPTQILILLPAMSVIISFQRGVMVYIRKTIHVTIATVVEVTGIVLVLSITIFVYNWNGVIAASTAVLTGRLAANIYLYFPVRRARI